MLPLEPIAGKDQEDELESDLEYLRECEKNNNPFYAAWLAAAQGTTDEELFLLLDRRLFQDKDKAKSNNEECPSSNALRQLVA